LENSPPKKTNLTLIAVLAVIVVVIVIAAALVLSNSDGGNGTGSDTDTAMAMEIGDFLEYTISMGDMQQTIRYTVMDVTQTSYIMNVTTNSPFGGTTYFEQEWPKNDTMGSDFDFDNPPTGVTVQYKGVATITTEWGSRSAHHYEVTSGEGDASATMQFWIKNNILLQSEGTSMDISLVVELTDTNIPGITG